MRKFSLGLHVRVGTMVLAVMAGMLLWNLPAESPEAPPEDSGMALGFFSDEKFAAMGIQEFKKLKESKDIVGSGSRYDMTQNVAARLVPLVDVPSAEWEFVLFKDDSPNAFALPGGKVGVHTGLFKVVDNEAQLAAVLGHELAHVTEGHAKKRLQTTGLAVGAATIGGLILKKKTGSDAPGAVAAGAATLGVLNFSRSQELDADRVGTLLMARGGYNPEEAITLWKQFAAYKEASGGNKLPGFLSTHPVDTRRIEELEALMPEAKKQYKPAREAKVAGDAVPAKSTDKKEDKPAKAEKLDPDELPKAQRFFRGLFGGGN